MRGFRRSLVVVALGAAVLVGGVVAPAAGYTAANPTYSTNDFNRTHGGPYVTEVGSLGRLILLRFVNPNPYAACFEYRTDGNTGQATGQPNFNPAITDGLYPYVCLNGAGSQFKLVVVRNDVEVRSVFGAERSWDFTWTAFSR